MMSIPIGLNNAGLTRPPFTSYVLLVIFEDENIERMKEHDPGELVIEKLGLPWSVLQPAAIHFIYASPDEVRTLMSLPPDQVQGYIKTVLFRGWKFQPEKGDNDDSYQRPKQN